MKTKIAVLVLLGMLLTQCVTTIQSNKSPNFNRTIKKFYVVVKVADNTQSFVPKFSTAFTELLKVRGCEAVFNLLDPLSLENEQALVTKIKESGADALMVISQTESVTHQGYGYWNFGQVSGGTFDIRVFEPANDNPIWRGNLKSNTGGYGGIGAVAKKSAEQLFNKLVQDRMI
jgi:hypothetical protein